jgi:hypothetical protein
MHGTGVVGEASARASKSSDSKPRIGRFSIEGAECTSVFIFHHGGLMPVLVT